MRYFMVVLAITGLISGCNVEAQRQVEQTMEACQPSTIFVHPENVEGIVVDFSNGCSSSWVVVQRATGKYYVANYYIGGSRYVQLALEQKRAGGPHDFFAIQSNELVEYTFTRDGIHDPTIAVQASTTETGTVMILIVPEDQVPTAPLTAEELGCLVLANIDCK